MKQFTGSAFIAMVALTTIATLAIATSSSAAGRDEVDPALGIYFTWLAGSGDFDGASNESSNSYVSVDVRHNKYIGVEFGYIALGGPGNEGLHLGLSHYYEASDKLDLTASLGHGFTGESDDSLEGSWMTYGAGFVYDLGKNFGFRGRWLRLDSQGDTYWAGFHYHLSGFLRDSRR